MSEKIKISDSVTSNDSNIAASSKAVKMAYDRAENMNRTVNSPLIIQPGTDIEGSELKLFGLNQSMRTIGFDNLDNKARIIFYAPEDKSKPLITFEITADDYKQIVFGKHNIPLATAPSTRYINIGYRENYTCPADGYISYRCNGSDAHDYICLTGSMIEISSCFGNNGNGIFAGYIPVYKGETVHMAATITGTWYYVRFVYAEGSY